MADKNVGTKRKVSGKALVAAITSVRVRNRELTSASGSIRTWCETMKGSEIMDGKRLGAQRDALDTICDSLKSITEMLEKLEKGTRVIYENYLTKEQMDAVDQKVQEHQSDIGKKKDTLSAKK